MRRVLVFISLAVLVILAYVQPRPVVAQTNTYWVMPVEGWYLPYSTPATSGFHFIASLSGYDVPTNNTLVGFFLYTDAVQTLNTTPRNESMFDAGVGMDFNPANLRYYWCVITISNSTTRNNVCNDLRQNQGVEASWPSTPQGGTNIQAGTSFNSLTAGQAISTDLYVWQFNAAARTGNTGFTHMIFYGVPPAFACFEPLPGSGIEPLTVEFADCSTGDIDTWDWYIDDVFYSDEQEPDPYEFEDAGTYFVTLVVNEGETNEDSVTLPVTVFPPVTYVRPFTAVTEGVPLGGIDAPAEALWLSLNFAEMAALGTGVENTVTAFSQGHAPVHAARSGTVTSIDPLTYADCDTDSDTCYAIFGSDISGAFAGLFNGYLFEYLISDVYSVTLETDTNEFLTYMVTNPSAYTQIGATVSEGCPLGESIPLVRRQSAGIIADISNFIWQGIAAAFSVSIEDVQTAFGNIAGFQPAPTTEFTMIRDSTVVSGNVLVVPIIDQLVDYPEDEPRTCEYQESACMNADPELNNPGYWTPIGAVEFYSGGGVILNPGAAIYAQLSLDPETTYTVEAWARTFSGTGSYAVQLGQTLQIFQASENFQQQTIGAATYAPDLGLFYTLSIANTGTVPVFLQSICVREPGEGGYLPNTCYFENPSFDGLPAAQGWTTTGTVNDGLIPGEIIMFNGDTIAQNAQLYPDGVDPHVYFVMITATVGGADIATLQADSTSEVGFDYSYGMTSDSFVAPNSATDYPVSGFFSGVSNGITLLPNNEIVFFAYVTVASFQNDSFEIEAVIDSANPNLFVRVRHVCIDDPFLHHDDPDAFIPPPPFAANCVGISPPQGNDVSSWTFYLWSNLDRFFKCDLMVLLNRMHDTAQKAYALMGWQLRYWQSVLFLFTRWLSTDTIFWLEGHFRNMAVGQVTTIESAPGASLWDVLLALINLVLGPLVESVREIITVLLGIISQAVNLLLTVIQAVITFVLALLIQSLNLFGLAQQLLNTIITAYNSATPTPLPGMPDCSTELQTNAWCIALWVLENTIFSGTGAAIIPLISGILGIHLILWIVGEIRKTVMQTGQSS